MKLKEWLTVPDAARHLSILFGEDVSEADVLRLALDGHLVLSVYFVNHARAQCGKIVPVADAERLFIQIDENTFFNMIDGLDLGEDRVFTYDKEVARISGVWDLTMIGSEQLDVEHKYQCLTGGPAVDLIVLDGPLVNSPNGTWARIVDRFPEKLISDRKVKLTDNHENNYYPAGGLPSGAVFVVRTSALQKLEAQVSEPEPGTERAIGRRERSTLLVIVAALAKLARIDFAKPSSAAASIESQTALMGVRVAARTIENHLKRIPEALDNKTND